MLENTDGIYGGRFSGAGFNGSSIALVDPQKEDIIKENVYKKYISKYPELNEKIKIIFVNTADGMELNYD